MSQDNMELNKSANGVFLSYWDTLNGNDACFRITDKGVYLLDDNGNDGKRSVNLPKALLKLADRICS